MPVTIDYAVDRVLKEAEKLLEKGWMQGQYYKTFKDEITHYCAMGALIRAQENLGYGYGSFVFGDAARKIARSLGEEPINWNLTEWNDDPKRTKEEVLEAFKKAQELK